MPTYSTRAGDAPRAPGGAHHGGGCVWVKCPCGGSGPHPRCWVLGWCWCSRRVAWLPVAIVAATPPPPVPWGRVLAWSGPRDHNACCTTPGLRKDRPWAQTLVLALLGDTTSFLEAEFFLRFNAKTGLFKALREGNGTEPGQQRLPRAPKHHHCTFGRNETCPFLTPNDAPYPHPSTCTRWHHRLTRG